MEKGLMLFSIGACAVTFISLLYMPVIWFGGDMFLVNSCGCLLFFALITGASFIITGLVMVSRGHRTQGGRIPG